MYPQKNKAMGFFDLFGKKNSNNATESVSSVPWEVLNSVEQLEELEKESHITPVVIFKHSTRCGISRLALRSFEKGYEIPEEKLKVYYLDLLAHRDVSDEIAMRFQVIHQSPQIIVIRNGQTIHHASHYSIEASDLAALLN